MPAERVGYIAAVLRAMKEDMEQFDDVPDDIVMFLPRFVDLIDSTPALRAAWLKMYNRIVTVATEALAAQAEVDPRDPRTDDRRAGAEWTGRRGARGARAGASSRGCAASSCATRC